MKIHTHTHTHTHVFRIWCPLYLSLLLYYYEEIKRELFKETLSLSPISVDVISIRMYSYIHNKHTH